MKHGAAKQAQRIAWLQAHPDLLALLPSTDEDVRTYQAVFLGSACREMREAGLYAKTTQAADIRWGIRVLVRLIRQGDGL